MSQQAADPANTTTSTVTEPDRPSALDLVTSAQTLRRDARRTRKHAQAVRAAAAATRTAAPPRPAKSPRATPSTPPANRSLTVRGVLGDLWGSELPPAPDPWLVFVQDALAIDDSAGREQGFIVYADAIALDSVADVLAQALTGHPRAMTLLGQLPTALREQVRFRWHDPHTS